MPLSNAQALAYLYTALGRVEPEIIRPFKEYTYTRDLPLMNTLSRTIEAIVLRNITQVGQGTTAMGGRSWIGRGANDLKGVDYDMKASAIRVYTGGREASWTGLDIERAVQTDGIQFDAEQVSIINDIFQGEADEIAYLGDKEAGFAGLANNSDVKRIDGSGLLTKAVADIDFGTLSEAITDYTYQAAQLTNDVLTPNTLLVSPAQYVKMFSLKMSDINRTSFIRWLQTESYAVAKAGACRVFSCKWLTGAGEDGVDRAILYTPDTRYLRYDIMPMWREKTYDKGLEFAAAYLWRISEVQFRHPETIVYVDNL